MIRSLVVQVDGEVKSDLQRIKSSVKDVLNVKSLDRLHQVRDYDIVTRERDQETIWHKLYYEAWGDEQTNLNYGYRMLVKDFVAPMFSEPIVYQAVPTFRVQLANNLAVGEWHRDRDYGHSVHEVNFVVPLNDAKNEAAVHIMDGHGVEIPLHASFGEVIVFDGANVFHGNQVNTTGKTRVSLDFRVIPLSWYVASTTTSINTNKKFEVGDYFNLMVDGRVQ